MAVTQGVFEEKETAEKEVAIVCYERGAICPAKYRIRLRLMVCPTFCNLLFTLLRRDGQGVFYPKCFYPCENQSENKRHLFSPSFRGSNTSGFQQAETQGVFFPKHKGYAAPVHAPAKRSPRGFLPETQGSFYPKHKGFSTRNTRGFLPETQGVFYPKHEVAYSCTRSDEEKPPCC